MHTSRNKSKHKGLKRIFYSAKYGFDGLIYAYKNEKSLILHAITTLVSVILGFTLNISVNQWMVILISIGIILAFELINTAIEACVDMVTVEYNELAKIAKDCGSAASVVTSGMYLIIFAVIFIPKIIELFSI